MSLDIGYARGESSRVVSPPQWVTVLRVDVRMKSERQRSRQALLRLDPLS